MDDLKLKCSECGNEFTQKKNLYAHLRKFHQIEPINSKPELNFLCNLCGKRFSCQSTLTRHTRQTHDTYSDHDYTIKSSSRKIRLICPHDTCCDKFVSYVHLRQHLIKHHNIEVEYEDFNFHSIADFERWKTQIQDKTHSLYTRDTTIKSLRSGVKRMFYNCHRSYNYKSKGKNLRVMKSIGTNKIGKACPSRLEVTITEHNEELIISVKFWKTHCGHTEQIRRMVLSKDIRSELAELLKDGVSFDEILDSIQDSKSRDISQRLVLLDRKDLYNITRDFNIKLSK